MILGFIILGFVASVIGALPLGASNIAVINTTLRHNLKHALKIAVTAGLAEVILSFYALQYNMMVNDFFVTNQWLQIVIALVLLGVGAFLFLKKHKTSKKTIKPKRSFYSSKYMTGFLLGLLNPPVLVYWLLVYSAINSNITMLTNTTSTGILILFFIGVYLGKVSTLYAYSNFSLIIQKKFQDINAMLNKVTGVLLFVIGIVQFAKLYFV